MALELTGSVVITTWDKIKDAIVQNNLGMQNITWIEFDGNYLIGVQAGAFRLLTTIEIQDPPSASQVDFEQEIGLGQ